MSVRINFEIGHEAAIRSKRTIDGFTHDWEVFVRGCDNTDIHYFVEKVVFQLHETFPNPKRVVKDPPYQVRESGYAGFVLPIDIYLRTNEEPKKIRFNYDLNLQPNGPAIIKVKKEKYTFNNPSEEFRHKLLRGGGVLISSGSDSARELNDKLSKPKLNSSLDSLKKHKIKEHKQEDSFTNLFGTPIKTSKATEIKIPSKGSPINIDVKEKSSSSKKSKSKHSPKEKDKDRDKEKKDKSQERKHKEEKKKEKERSKEKERKDKNVKRERSPKQLSASPRRSPKRLSSPKRAPSPKRPPSPPIIKPKEDKKIEDFKEKAKIDLKIKRDQKEKEKEKKEHKSHKEKEVNRSIDPKEHKSSKEIKLKEQILPKIKEKIIKPEDVPIKESEKFEKTKPEKLDTEKQKHKHKKKDSKEKKEKKEEKIKEKKAENKIDKTNSLFGKGYKEDIKDSPKDIEKSSNLLKLSDQIENNNSREKTSKVLSAEFIENSSDSSIISHDDSSIEVPVKPIEKIEVKKSKDKNKEGSPEKKKKRKHEVAPVLQEEPQLQPEEPPPKVTREEPEYTKQIDLKKDVVEDDTQDYMSILKELQHKIMTLQNNDELQRVVQMIAETGKYEVTTSTFDFDLCALDRDTVQRLQDFFALS